MGCRSCPTPSPSVRAGDCLFQRHAERRGGRFPVPERAAFARQMVRGELATRGHGLDAMRADHHFAQALLELTLAEGELLGGAMEGVAAGYQIVQGEGNADAHT